MLRKKSKENTKAMEGTDVSSPEGCREVGATGGEEIVVNAEGRRVYYECQD